jgi:hypothetical protein
MKRYINFLGILYSERQQVLHKDRLGLAGERFVRDMLVQSARFSDITLEKDLGKVGLGPKRSTHKLDLKATPIFSETPYGISVKNERQIFHSNKAPIHDVIVKAEAHKLKPWLIVSNVHSSARLKCKRLNVRLDELGRQVVPAEFDIDDRKSQSGNQKMPSAINRLRAVIGPMQFIYLNQRFRSTDYEKYRSSLSSLDAETPPIRLLQLARSRTKR